MGVATTSLRKIKGNGERKESRRKEHLSALAPPLPPGQKRQSCDRLSLPPSTCYCPKRGKGMNANYGLSPTDTPSPPPPVIDSFPLLGLQPKTVADRTNDRGGRGRRWKWKWGLVNYGRRRGGPSFPPWSIVTLLFRKTLYRGALCAHYFFARGREEGPFPEKGPCTRTRRSTYSKTSRNGQGRKELHGREEKMEERNNTQLYCGHKKRGGGPPASIYTLPFPPAFPAWLERFLSLISLLPQLFSFFRLLGFALS